MIPGLFAAQAAGAVAPPDPLAEAIWAKLLHWWDFDGNAFDEVGNNVLSGAATYQAGHIGEKVVKGAVLLSGQLGKPAIDAGVSFGGWIYIDGTGDENPITLKTGGGAATSATQSHYLAVRSSGTQLFLVGYPAAGANVAISTSAGAMAVGNWHFVVGSVSPTGAMKLYLDGAVVASGSVGGPPKGYPYLQFGRSDPTVLNALHNDASFVAQELTDEEVLWLYNGGAGRPGATLDPYPPMLVAMGAWTWFNDPRAIQAGDQLLVGSVSSGGVIQLDYSDDGFQQSHGYVALEPAGSPDDHDNPGFLRRADGKLLAFYTRHNNPSCWLRISTSSDDASDWGPAVNLQPQLGTGPYSYNNPIQLTGLTNQPIYNFFRRGSSPNWTLHVSKSLDGGTTWSPAEALLAGGRPYFKVARNGDDRIDFLVTDGHPGALATSVYHFYYQAGEYHGSAGNALGPPPFGSGDLTKIFDGTTAAGRAWIWDIQAAPDGSPVVLYSRFPSTDDHRYMYARWTGSSWVSSEICEAGRGLYSAEPYYSGGICLDPDDVSVVYASREEAGRWTLFRYSTLDNGATWVEEPLGAQGLRPYAVPGTDYLLAMTVRYSTFTDFNTGILLRKR